MATEIICWIVVSRSVCHVHLLRESPEHPTLDSAWELGSSVTKDRYQRLVIGECFERCSKNEDLEVFTRPGDSESLAFSLRVSLLHWCEGTATVLDLFVSLSENSAHSHWACVSVDGSRQAWLTYWISMSPWVRTTLTPTGLASVWIEVGRLWSKNARALAPLRRFFKYSSRFRKQKYCRGYAQYSTAVSAVCLSSPEYV